MILTFKLEGYPIGIILAAAATKDEMLSAATAAGCSTETCMKNWRWRPSVQSQAHTAVLPCHRVILWFKTDTPTAATIAHEAFHAIYAALPQLGIQLARASEEAFAYAIDNLVRQVIEGLEELRAAQGAGA